MEKARIIYLCRLLRSTKKPDLYKTCVSLLRELNINFKDIEAVKLDYAFKIDEVKLLREKTVKAVVSNLRLKLVYLGLESKVLVVGSSLPKVTFWNDRILVGIGTTGLLKIKKVGGIATTSIDPIGSVEFIGLLE